ncbi:hypothetical protein VTJ49DRAFT_5051 [Mycothermus thermophilus]|uniref:Uncharacterized protein n=1 Tax=Humicola insolens TaxID=85995 RepID=A0ABR3V471_HUMIN
MEKTHAHHHHKSANMSSQAQSSVGMRSIYESGDQRNYSQADVEEQSRQSGKNIKGYMPKDQVRKLDKLYMEQVEREREEHAKNDPTWIAHQHGRRPSQGAIIDKEIQEEEEAYLRKKAEREAMAGKKSYE